MQLILAGFKLDTLLKLSDVKGVDRKTSLLHFVVASLLKRHSDRPGGIGTLSTQLSAVKPAANLQVLRCLSCVPTHSMRHAWLTITQKGFS